MDDCKYQAILSYKKDGILPNDIIHKSNYIKVCERYTLNKQEDGLMRDGKEVLKESMLPQIISTFIRRNIHYKRRIRNIKIISRV